MATASAGTSSVMTDPEAVSAPSPTVTGATSMVSEPMKARFPISVIAEGIQIIPQHFGIGGTEQLDAEDAGVFLR